MPITYIFKIFLKKNKLPLDLTGLSITLIIFKSDTKFLIASDYIAVTDVLNGELLISLPTQKLTSIDDCNAQISLNSINTNEIIFPKFTFKSAIDNVVKSGLHLM